MPGPIEAFEGNNITTKPETVANVFLQHEPGTRFFSVKSLLQGHGRFERHPRRLGLQLPFLLLGQPDSDPDPGRGADHLRDGTARSRISARRLYDILQDAKTYFVLKDQHPELERTIQVAAPGKVLEYPGYRIVIDQVFKFGRDDTVVFRAIFLNDTEAPLYYRPGEIGLRVGRNLYWPSFAEVPQVIPPRRPARLMWEISPDVISLEITSPTGKKASVLDRLSAPLTEPGQYTLTAHGKAGRADSLKFRVVFPVPPSDPNPLVVAKGAGDFGIRRLVLEQPEPGQNFGYVCYSGTADGGRANLSLDNDFSLVVPVHAAP